MTSLQKPKKLAAYAEIKRWLITPDDLPYDLDLTDLKTRETRLHRELLYEGIGEEVLCLPGEELATVIFDAIQKQLKGIVRAAKSKHPSLSERGFYEGPWNPIKR